MSLRSLFQWGIEFSGGLRLKRMLTRNRYRILMYHRVTAEKFTNGLHPQEFEKQIAYVKSNYRVVSVEQLVEELRLNQLKPYTVCLTFDDGHEDFYDYAWPILKEYEVPASLYVTTGFVDQTQWLWPDLIKYLLVQSIGKRISYHQFGGDLITPESVRSLWSRAGDIALQYQAGERQNWINGMAQSLNQEIPEKPVPPFNSVSWSQITEMIKGGLCIGSHTVTHPILAKESEDIVYSELHDSATRIEAMTGVFPKGICYPNGMPGDVSKSAISAAKKAGYQFGLMACTSHQLKSGVYSLGRISTTDDFQELKWRLSSI